MACYYGTRGGCAKCRWATFIICLSAAISLLAASLYKTIPGLQGLVKCVKSATDVAEIAANIASVAGEGAGQLAQAIGGQSPQLCLKVFWTQYQIPFILSIVGAACVVVALLTCCCFCCAEPPARAREEGQYALPVQDTHGGDQFYASPTPQLPPYKPGGPGAPRAFQ